MKKLIALLLVATMLLSMVACGSSKGENTASNGAAGTANEEDLIENEAWDTLASLGKVETENGILTVSITLPADFVGEITEDELNANAGENYTSAKLNDDGSVTYKMTKKQHKAMLDNLTASLEEALLEMVNNETYSITDIKHNTNFTEYDITLEGNEVGFVDYVSAISLFVYGSMYSMFTGVTVENIAVNFYGANGNLIETWNSAEMGV